MEDDQLLNIGFEFISVEPDTDELASEESNEILLLRSNQISLQIL